MGIGAMIGGSIISGVIGSRSASRQAEAVENAADRSAEVQLEMYNQSRDDLEPYREAGYNALAAMQYEMGLAGPPGIAPQISEIPGTGSQTWPTPSASSATRFLVDGQYFDTREEAETYANDNTFDYRGFEATPGYQFRLDEGNKALERSAAARGLRLSSGTMKEMAGYNQDMASQEYGNYYNRLAGLSGTGQSATNTGVSAGQNYANQAGNAFMNAGQARATGYAGQTSALNSTLNNLTTIGGMQQAGFFGSGGNANALSTPWASAGFWG